VYLVRCILTIQATSTILLMRHLFIPVHLILALITAPALADEIDDILAGDTAPPGIVFEVVSDEADLLKDVLPAISNDIKRLRKRFPGLDIAIVSHGDEQFALTTDNRANNPELHEIAQTLVDDQQVSMHVCETYAEWNGVSAEEFAEFVDVSATGPAQINDYRALGYIVILLP
jgi:intracellular sulfur oxidation DsrE/DsrF family protein